MIDMKYFIAITHNFGDIIVRAVSKREAEELLNDSEISYIQLLPIKQYTDKKVGREEQGVVY